MHSGDKLSRHMQSFVIRVHKFLYLKQACLGKYVKVKLLCVLLGNCLISQKFVIKQQIKFVNR